MPGETLYLNNTAESESTGNESDISWLVSAHHTQRLGNGAVLFTGPDGIRDHRVTVEKEHHYVGEGTMSPEGTSDVAYLWRPASGMPPPRPKTACVGEVGWGIPRHADWSVPNTGAQIALGEFRQAVEDRHTHLYQSAWYPGPDETFPQNSDAALVMNVYKTGNKDNNTESRYTPRRRPHTAGSVRKYSSDSFLSSSTQDSYRHRRQQFRY